MPPEGGESAVAQPRIDEGGPPEARWPPGATGAGERLGKKHEGGRSKPVADTPRCRANKPLKADPRSARAA